MPKRPPPPGRIHMTSAPGEVEVLSGYDGPRKANDLPYRLPPRRGEPKPRRRRAEVPATTASVIQVDGRSATDEQVWSGMRFIFKVHRLVVKSGETTLNLFTTHIGRTVANVPHWTEIGVFRAAGDSRYRLFTFDSEVAEPDRWEFFGTMKEGEVFEFAIRLNENDTGPYPYETFCSGKLVRKGKLPRLDCQVDVSHESWSPTGTFSDGDHVIEVEGWLN